MKKTTMTIVRDTREQTGYKFPNMTIATLKTGDYTVLGYEDLICIERKNSTGEIYGNFFEKRFARELDRMMKFRYRIILCEFSYQDVLTFPVNSTIPKHLWKKVSPKARYFQRLMIETQVRGIHMHFAGNAYNAKIYLAHTLKILLEKINNE